MKKVVLNNGVEMPILVLKFIKLQTQMNVNKVYMTLLRQVIV